MSTPLVDSVTAILRAVLPADVPISAGATTQRWRHSAAVVEVLDGGPWAIPRGTQELRVVHLNILADCTREDGLPVADDADRRAWAIYEDIHDVLHDVAHELKNSDSRIHESSRVDGPSFTNLPDGDGSVMCTVRYAILSD